MAQYTTGIRTLLSLVGLSFLGIDNGGPEAARVQVKGGTFVCDGATPVAVDDTTVNDGSNILISLDTVGGTVGALPTVKTKTSGTGFTVSGTAGDTSTYNYLILA